ncbi:MAG: AAA domain-containing protein [Candidatus Firestonebacteria bacterium]
MNNILQNFIKYCLGYINITRQKAFTLQQKYSVSLNSYFLLNDLLKSDIDIDSAIIVNLDTFYKYDPGKVTKENQNIYEEQKIIANKLEEINNEYKNDQFRKQIILNFGFFQIEIPRDEEENQVEIEDEEDNAISKVKDKNEFQQSLSFFEDNIKNRKYNNDTSKYDKYPIFSIVVNIKKIYENGVNKFYIYPIDTEVKINIQSLNKILGEELYYHLIETFGVYELEDKLSLPLVESDILKEVWGKIKAQLKHTDVKFDENTFKLDEVKIALNPRTNYFLAEDLQKLSKMEEEKLDMTVLKSWINNEDLNIEDNIPQEEDIYFPFKYDRFQLRSLSLMSNRAAIVQGPPGTGKSETISNILCHLAAKGKRVLFVSQKAQALKVVKDKLKTLNVKYLFGYIPNPSSAQLNEQDEIDGIAPQLTALNSYIEKLGFIYDERKRLTIYKEYEEKDGNNDSLVKIIKKKEQLKYGFNEQIEKEREICGLYMKYKNIDIYNINIPRIKDFKNNLSLSKWKCILEYENEIERLNKEAEKYEKEQKGEKYSKIFINIDCEYEFCDAICKIREDINKTGYDRHSKYFKKFNNILRNIRMRKTFLSLPREILDFINSVQNSDISRKEKVEQMDDIIYYFQYKKSKKVLKQLNKDMKMELHSYSIDNDTILRDIKNLLNTDSDFEVVKNKIIESQTIMDRIKSIRNEIEINVNLNYFSNSLKKVKLEHSQCIAQYLKNIIDKRIIDRWKAGVEIRQAINKLAKAFRKSKKAYKTFDEIRKDSKKFKEVLSLVPIWIMELDDASRIMPLESGLFDYVILDEASQCNIAYTLPSMYRSNHAIFVGDSEQMRDNTIIFKSNKMFDELACRYKISEELQIKSTGNAVQSVLDIATLRGFISIPLRYHYRSPRELIGFSNKYFYSSKGKELIVFNHNYFLYKDTSKIMIIHQVEDVSKEFSDKVSVAEAEEILKLFKKLKKDVNYEDKSIGILTFFNAQATYLRELFEKEGFKEEENNYKISIIEGIQGDEKDIIIYSFVIRNADQKNKYLPLTGEGGDIRGDINRGRVNVAFTRAKLQVHCFISMDIKEIPNGIWIRKYLEYVNKYGKVNCFENTLNKFDSHFEEEFYGFIKNHFFDKDKYMIQNQVKSCGFRIDFVINNLKNSKKVAIECDGPTHFKNELDEELGIYIESDEERQGVLESAQWKFYRIRYSDWIREDYNRNNIIKDVATILE